MIHFGGLKWFKAAGMNWLFEKQALVHWNVNNCQTDASDVESTAPDRKEKENIFIQKKKN